VDTKLSDDFPLKVAVPTADWHVPDREQIRRGPADNLWQRSLAWIFLLTGFAFFLFVRAKVRGEVSITVAMTESLFLLGVSQALLIYLYRKATNHIEPGSGFRRLYTKVPPHADLPVQVEIVRAGSMTGRDRGYVWFEEGTWYFKGLQTAFRLNQQDVVPIEAWSRAIRPDPPRDKPPRLIPLKGGHAFLRVDVLDPYEDYAKRKRVKGFYRELYDWLNERPRGALESLLPPTKVHPDLHRTDLARYEALVAAIVMVGLDTAVLAGLPRGGTSTNLGNYGLVAGLFVSVLLFLALRFAYHEFRDLTVRARLSRSD
jgi:hypothetical protein